MNQKIEDLLAKPFPPEDIEWRVSRCGKKDGKSYAWVIAYIDSRAVMDRLDQVFGIDGWQDSYQHHEEGFIATLKVKIGNEWIEKSDGAPKTSYESFKGGISDALKRVAVKFKIGRYLYKLPEMYVVITAQRQNNTDKYIYDDNKNITGYWAIPQLPSWALPEGNNGNGNNGSVDISEQEKRVIKKYEELLAMAETLKADSVLSQEEYDQSVAAIEKYSNYESKLDEFKKRFDKKMVKNRLN